MSLSELSSEVGLMIRKISIVFLLFLTFAFTAGLVNAQGVGVSINPATINETIDPGVVKEYSLTVQNLSSKEQEYFLFTRNIVGVEEGGVPVFDKEGIVQTGYELSDWIELSQTSIIIPAGDESSISFIMSVPDIASPGGHFGGVFVSVEPPDIENSGAAVGYQVASILSIRVSGDAHEEASIRQFSTSKFVYGTKDIEFSARIENSGNVLVKPVGPVEIYSMLGKKVDTFIFNEDQKAVVPAITDLGRDRQENVTEFTFTWQDDGVGFGRYEAILSPVYGDFGAKKTMSSTVTFWVLPMNIIGPALGVLAVVLLIVFMFVKLYIRRSLAYVHHGRRMITRRKKKGSSATLLIIVVSLGVTALFLIVLLALFA